MRAAERIAQVRIDGMRLLFEQNGAPETALVRPLHVMAVSAAALIGLVVRTTAELPVSRIVAWCAIIFLGEALITALNRAYAARLCSGQRVLDVYSYAGGFGVLAATQEPQHVTLIDRSDVALSLAHRAAEANAVAERCHFLKADALTELERLAAAGETFGVVIADPPAFIKNKKDMGAGLKGYRKLARLAASVVAPQGILCLGSCSYHAELSAWMEENARGVIEAGRTGRILRTSGAGADHPVHPLLPESAYLKFEVFQLD